MTPAEIVERLRPLYGQRQWRPHGDAVAELVLTILSQNTSDRNSGRAFATLMDRYGSWDAVVDAPTNELVDTIRVGGLALQKAPRIQAVLHRVREAAAGWDLGWLDPLPLDEARAWLTGLPGVGPKTAACVLLFACGRPALPVDTHVHRVARRLGIIEPKTSEVKAHVLLEALVPPERVYDFHVLLIKHGRRTCTARGPRCDHCPLLEGCPRVGLPPREPSELPA